MTMQCDQLLDVKPILSGQPHPSDARGLTERDRPDNAEQATRMMSRGLAEPAHKAQRRTSRSTKRARSTDRLLGVSRHWR